MSTASNAVAASEVYDFLKFCRDKDEYQSGMSLEEMIKTYFPPSIPDFVQDMSDITAAFYGTMLSKTQLFWGASAIDALATATITEMGHFKARQALQRYPDLPQDARGLLLILLSGIISASPEYRFSIFEFTADHVRASISGKDRYFRIAAAKGLQEKITWPTILHFLRGANAELKWDYEIQMDVKQLEPDGSCLYEFVISPRQNKIQHIPEPPAFLQMEEHEAVRCFGQLAYVPLGKLKQYQGEGFSELLRKAVSLEAYNYSWLEDNATPLYMLAENMSARKCGPIDDEKSGYAVIKSRTLSGKKKHVLVSIMDEAHIEVYEFTFDYYLWEQSVYEEKFSFLKTAATNSKEVSTIPELTLLQGDNSYSFRYALPAFSEALCADHYPGYPCVPAVHIHQLLVSASLNWLQEQVSKDIVMISQDFTELLPVKMIPVGMSTIVHTKVLPLSKKRFRFQHEIRDTSGAELHLVVTTDISFS